jgi:hypothetical protein
MGSGRLLTMGCGIRKRRGWRFGGRGAWHWTTERDAAEFTVEILLRDDVVDGGFRNVCSGVSTLKEIAATYEAVRGARIEIEMKGTVAELREYALEERKRGS